MQSMEERRSSTAVREVPSQEECRHHWVIESPDGPMSKGACRLCGAEREFRNYLENPRWEDFTLDRPAYSERSEGVSKEHNRSDEEA